jgi:hypothetical protein
MTKPRLTRGQTTLTRSGCATAMNTMKIRIHPILNLEPLNALGLEADDVRNLKQQTHRTLETLRSQLGSEVVLASSDAPPVTLSATEVVLWFVFSEAEVETIAVQNAVMRARTILFGYPGDDPLGALEVTGAAGLVTNPTVQSWESERAKRFHKMGQGHGLYGLKRLFDATRYDPVFLKIMASDHYCIFYNYEVHDLEKLLMSYLERLVSDVAIDTVR